MQRLTETGNALGNVRVVVEGVAQPQVVRACTGRREQRAVTEIDPTLLGALTSLATIDPVRQAQPHEVPALWHVELDPAGHVLAKRVDHDGRTAGGRGAKALDLLVFSNLGHHCPR